MDPGMDLLQGVQDGAEGPALGGGDFEMPSFEKMMEILNQMDMPEEEKAQLKDALMNNGDMLSNLAKLGAGGLVDDSNPSMVGNLSPNTQFMVFFIAIAIVGSVIAFFGYKLYKSLTEKERKREEKKKLKLQKKKK